MARSATGPSPRAAGSTARPTCPTRSWVAWTPGAGSACASTCAARIAARSARARLLRALGDLLAQALLLRARLGGELVAEVAGLEDRTDLDLALAHVRVRAALDPLDRLRHRLDLPKPVAGEELLRLGEGTVDDRPLRTREAHALALRARVQALALAQHHAGLDQLLVEVAHRREELLGRHHA